jgi:hypothetical protein
MEDFATTSSCVHRNKRSYSEKKMDSYSFDKRNSGWKGKRGMIRSYGVDEINEFDFDFGGAKPSAYAKYLIQKYKDVVENYERIDTEEQKSNGKKVSLSKDVNANSNGNINANCSCHSFGGSGIDLYDYLKRNKKKLKGCKYNLVYEGSNENGEINANKGRKNVDVDSEKMIKKIQVIKRK